jgi:serine/threonine protein phosphatase PrpC
MDHSESGWGIWTCLDWPCQGRIRGSFTHHQVELAHVVIAILGRSLGDVVAHSAGVISDPEFTEFELDSKTDKFLVVATDGLWEFISNQETTDIVEGQIGPAQAVDALVTEAGTRWMQEEQVIDDTTVIVANLFGWKPSS